MRVLYDARAVECDEVADERHRCDRNGVIEEVVPVWLIWLKSEDLSQANGRDRAHGQQRDEHRIRDAPDDAPRTV